jgi:lipopolysaccharide biosynthesis regulator YciM
MPTGLSNRVEFYNSYRDMFYYFANSEYEKAVNIANGIYSSSDPYINEALAQSYCSLGNIANANYYFHITKSLLNNNKLIEYEHADCLVRFGKEVIDVKSGIDKLYVLFTTDYKYYNIGDLIKHACDKINNSGVEGLSDLISAMQFYNAGKITEAKLSIEKAIAAKNFHDSKYYEQIKKYYTMLKNDEQQN